MAHATRRQRARSPAFAHGRPYGQRRIPRRPGQAALGTGRASPRRDVLSTNSAFVETYAVLTMSLDAEDGWSQRSNE